MKNNHSNKSIIIAIAAACCIIAICCIFEPSLILLLGAGAYGLYELYEYNKNQELLKKQQKQIYQNAVAETVYTATLRVLPKLSDLLDIEAPKMFSDLYSEPCVVNKKGVIFIRTRVRVTKNNAQDVTTQPAVMRLIQNTVNQCLICGDLNDIFCYPSVDGKNTILIVENVMFEDGYLVIDWGILNNQDMYNYLCQSSKVINISLPSKADEDF